MNVIGDPPARRRSGWTDLPDSPLAPSSARRWVSATLISWELRPSEDVHATIAGLTSELVTNVVKHAEPATEGGRGFTIKLTLEDDIVRIEVHDRDPTLPRLRQPDLAGEGGRGLLLVEAQAHQWGAVPHEGGKYVWFSMECPSGAERTSAISDPGHASAVSLPAP